MLKAEDKELNQWASLKKTYQYRSVEEEKYEVQAYSKKAANPKKKKLLASMYSDRWVSSPPLHHHTINYHFTTFNPKEIITYFLTDQPKMMKSMRT